MRTEAMADQVPDYAERRPFAAPVIAAIERTLQESSFEHRVWWNRVLTEMFDRFAPGSEPPAQGMDRQAFQFLAELAGHDANASITVVDDPLWLRQHLAALLIEAEAQRPAVVDSEFPVFGKPGRAALALTCDATFFAWAQHWLGVRLSTRMKITYIYYECPGQRCRLHLDNPTFYEYNCLIGLQTSRRDHQETGSRLRIIDAQAATHDIDLVGSRAVLFDGSRLAHARTPLRDGESIRILSIGLNAAGRD